MARLLSISSIDSFDSMPPLIDRFGNIVLDDRATIGSPMDVEEDNIQFNRPPEIQIPQNHHMYFGDDGEEISRDQFLENMAQEEYNERQELLRRQQEQEDQDEFYLETPMMNHKFVMKHPRVLLDFLRFIDSYNEVAEPGDLLMMRAIPNEVIRYILSHRSIRETPPEFRDQVNELKWRLSRHADLSELPPMDMH